MLLVVCTALTLATASPQPSEDRSAGRSEYSSEEALRRYALGRLLEEQGERSEALRELYRALMLDAESPSLPRRVSELSVLVGETQRSLEFAERALSLDSTDARALWLKGTALINLGQVGDALAPLERAVAIDSSRIEYLYALARAAEQLDRVDLVARTYRRALWVDEDDGETWFQVAAAEARLGRFSVADSALQEAVRRNPLRPGVLFLQAWIDESLGRSEQAVALYRQHLSLHPDDHTSRRRLIHLLLTREEHKEALKHAQLVAHARPNDLEARQAEADVAFRAGRPDIALRMLQRLRRERRDDVASVSVQVAVLARNGRARQAVDEAERWAARRPGDYRGLLVRARARSLNQETTRAAELLRSAIEMAPDSLEPRVVLARVYQDAKKLDEAERVWSETANRFPSVSALRYDLALCREQRGDLPGAEVAVRDVLAREPDNATALNFLGYMLADHNLKLHEAVTLIQRALELDPDNGAYIDSLGWAFYRLGRLDEARAELERAVRLTGGDPVVHEHLGDVYKDLRLNDLAKAQYLKSLAADGTNGRVRAKLAKLR